MRLRNTFLLILLPLLLYVPYLHNDFVALDDELLILDNPTAHGLSWKNIQNAFLSYDPELYIPLTLLTYQTEYGLFGQSSFPYHTTNLLLHLGSTVLLLYIFRKLLDEKTALVAALLFGIHPLNTETVMWASARKDVLMGFFFLLSMYFYMSERKRLSISAFLLACLAKVTAVTLPFILLAIDIVQKKPIDSKNIRSKLPYFIISIVFIIIALFGKHTPTSLLTPILISFVAVPFSLGKFLLPINLSIFYPFTDDVFWNHPRILIGFLIVATITIAVWILRKRSSLPLLSWIVFLMLLAPSLTNVLKGGEYGSIDIYITSDRYMYLPMIAILPLIAYILLRRPMLFATPIIIFALSYATYSQAKTWTNSETLFTHVIASQKNAHVAYNNLAGIYAKNREYERALKLYERSKAIKPTWRTLFNLGQIYGSLGRSPDAIDAYQELLLIRPDYAEALAQLGGLLLRQGDTGNALLLLERARMLDPNLTSVHYNLGLIYEHTGNTTRAHESFERVLQLNPSDSQAQKKLQNF
ncbi:tetratricopeptide repeat protein [Candidatus Peregrinibacteria bacterium]|nr:tetratricopeptide repeat protein [Candidatus Peregrinibacteria bacterium]